MEAANYLAVGEGLEVCIRVLGVFNKLLVLHIFKGSRGHKPEAREEPRKLLDLLKFTRVEALFAECNGPPSGLGFWAYRA